MISKADIGHWTGLTGVELGHLINLLDVKDVDWETVDWQVLGEEAQDYGDRYGAIWSKLANEYGIEKPVVESQIGQEMEEYGTEEEEFLHGTKEGVKEILSRIYKDPSISKKQKEAMKQALKEESSAYFTTLIALYDGEEQSFAKRWLGEEVVAPTPEDVKQLINKPIFSVLSRKGWIKAIDGVYLKHPMRSTKFVKLIPDYKLLHSEDRGEPGRVAVYRRPKEKPTVILKPPEIILEPKEKPTVILKPPEIILEPKEKPLYIKPDEKELTILQNIDNAKRALALHKKRKDTTMIEQDETLLGNYERMLEAYRRYKGKQLEKPTVSETPHEYRKRRALEAQKTPPEPVPPAIRETIMKPVEILPAPSEDLTLQYGYSELKKIASENNIRVTGSKSKIISKLLEVGVL